LVLGGLSAMIESQYPGFDQQYEVDYLLGRASADQADFDGARRSYQKTIRSPQGAKTETAAMAQWMIAESYFHQKNYDAALREYLRVEILYAFPRWQALALLQAGKCRQLLGESAEAARLYERVQTRYADSPAAAEAAQRLRAAASQTQKK
jgi:TolA-binding protein